MLAYVTGSVDEEELRLRNEYLITENRFLRNQINRPIERVDHDRRSKAQLSFKLLISTQVGLGLPNEPQINILLRLEPFDFDPSSTV